MISVAHPFISLGINVLLMVLGVIVWRLKYDKLLNLSLKLFAGLAFATGILSNAVILTRAIA